MRLLFLCGDHGIPVYGRKGASTHIRELIMAMRRAGCEVVLAACDFSGDRRSEEDYRTLKLPWPKSRVLGIDGRYMTANLLANSILRDFAIRFRPQAIYERSALYFTAGMKLARLLKCPRIVEVNTLLSVEQENRLHLPRRAAAVEVELLRSAQGIAAISEPMKMKLQSFARIDPSRIRPFSMAVDPVRFSRTGHRAARRANIGAGPNTKVIGYIGSMNHYHRPKWFFKMLPAIDKQFDDVRFVVIGGAPEKVQKHQEAASPGISSGKIHFLGAMPHAELPGWIEAMDLVVIPGSAPQATPTKIFEVAAVGTPLIAPATEPISLIVPEAAHGLLFPPEEQSAMTELIRQFCSDPAPFHQQVDYLRSHILAHHTWDSHARSILDWFGDLGAWQS